MGADTTEGRMVCSAKRYYREAERMCERSVEALREVLGGDDVEASYSSGILALTHRNQGRWMEAEKMEVQMTETSPRVLGEEHPGTLATISPS
jgi:Tetratricopeptide repeat